MTELSPDALKAHSKLFALLDEAGQRRLIAVATEESFPSGTPVVREGEFGDRFYLVLQGDLSVQIQGEGDGGVREVARLKGGSFFGEIAALLGEARSASVVCAGDVRVLRFDAPRVQGILKDYPKVREALVKLGLRRSEENLARSFDSDIQGGVLTTEGAALTSSSEP
jgi:CRP-like cAMP-binding protein